MTDKTEAETLALIEHYGAKFERLSNMTASGSWACPARHELIADANRLRKLVISLPEKRK